MPASVADAGTRDLERYRRELTGYCYRMLGSASEAEDAVQETFLRAWRGAASFEGRSSFRSWLYRIATNVCTDMHRQPQRRAQPMDLGPPSPPDERHLGPMLAEATWVTPMTDDRIDAPGSDPADVAAHRESVRLAFVAALQLLPARQRTALILCDVLRWESSEVAVLLETTTAAVNSALQRARATMGSAGQGRGSAGHGRGSAGRGGAGRPAPGKPMGAAELVLLDRYVDAFQRYDMDALLQVLHEDAVMNMPPFAMWLQGAADITRFMVEPGPSACRGSVLVPTAANGCPAFAQYKPDPSGGRSAWALQVVELDAAGVSSLTCFLDVDSLFPRFDLPLHID